MLEELAAALAKLDLQLYGRAVLQQQNYEFRLKRKLIGECLFGVDVQERAVALCRQRLWLALVACEQSGADSSLAVTIRESVSVPGLFQHIVCGDSLLGCRAYEDDDRDSFKWRRAFPEIFQKRGGFDILIGNPPYRPALPKSGAEKENWAQIGALFPHVKRSKNTRRRLLRSAASAGFVRRHYLPDGAEIADVFGRLGDDARGLAVELQPAQRGGCERCFQGSESGSGSPDLQP
jgi:hypothetical protein